MQAFRIKFSAMASMCELVVCALDEPTADHCARAAVAEVHRIEAKFSRYKPDTVVSRINATADGAPVGCDEETSALLDRAADLHRVSGGLFDITSGVLGQVWDFKAKKCPAVNDLTPLVALVGWDRVERDNQTIRLPQAGMQLDFGGFGKEYAADRAASVLQDLGVQHGYVNLAGDMRFVGPKPDGTPWTIGIRHPRKENSVLATIPMQTGGLATSGDYERFFELDGERFCHVLRPDTGWPVKHWQSISVIASDTATAGAICTIAMLKESGALEFLKSTGFKYLAVDRQGKLYYTEPEQASQEEIDHANV